MTMTEVADYLRVRERTVYELVRTRHIPSCKLSGKLLFPKRLIELWVAQSADCRTQRLTGSSETDIAVAVREGKADAVSPSKR